jgi:hypothetical protein
MCLFERLRERRRRAADLAPWRCWGLEVSKSEASVDSKLLAVAAAIFLVSLYWLLLPERHTSDLVQSHKVDVWTQQ